MDELEQWKADNLEITGKFTRACARIRELEAAIGKFRRAFEKYEKRDHSDAHVLRPALDELLTIGKTPDAIATQDRKGEP